MSGRHRGHIKIARALFQGPMWLEPRTFSRAEAWIDMIQRAAWASRTVSIQGVAIPLQRGELVLSVRLMADEWGWSKDRATRFATALVATGAVTCRPAARTGAGDSYRDSVGTIYRIVKYDAYQGAGGRDKDTGNDTRPDARKDTGKGTRQDTGKDKEEAGSKAVKGSGGGRGGKHAHSANGAPPPPAEQPWWIREACKLFSELLGRVDPERVSQELLRLTEDHEENEVLDGLECYLRSTDEKPGFKNPKAFAATAVYWIGEAQLQGYGGPPAGANYGKLPQA